MDIVEFLMTRRPWEKKCLRANIVPKEDVITWGKVKLAYVESNALRGHEHLLRDAIRNISPEWWEGETKVCLNRNVQCQKHRDGNKGHSWILWLGDFTGGALVFEDGTRIEEKYKWHRINGSIPHWNEPHEGTKYSIVLYRSKPYIAKTHRINKRIAERKHADAEPTWINMTEDIKNDFLEAVAKVHNIETKEILSNSINATT